MIIIIIIIIIIAPSEFETTLKYQIPVQVNNKPLKPKIKPQTSTVSLNRYNANNWTFGIPGKLVHIAKKSVSASDIFSSTAECEFMIPTSIMITLPIM